MELDVGPLSIIHAYSSNFVDLMFLSRLLTCGQCHNVGVIYQTQVLTCECNSVC